MKIRRKSILDYIEGDYKQNSICICEVVRQDAEPSFLLMDEQVAGETYTYTILQKPRQNKTVFLTDLLIINWKKQ